MATELMFVCTCCIVSCFHSDATGRCYIETANLDGETNLKIREVGWLSLHESNAGLLSEREREGNGYVARD